MVQDRISYAAVDAFNIPYPENHFDVVACKSVIGGLVLQRKRPETRTLKNQRLAVEEIRRVLKPGGIFLGAENLTGTKIHQFLRRMKYGPELGWRYLRTTEIQWLLRVIRYVNRNSGGSWAPLVEGWAPLVEVRQIESPLKSDGSVFV